MGAALGGYGNRPMHGDPFWRATLTAVIAVAAALIGLSLQVAAVKGTFVSLPGALPVTTQAYGWVPAASLNLGPAGSWCWCCCRLPHFDRQQV